VEGLSTIRYLTTVSFGFGASALLGEVLAELAIVGPLVVTDPGVRSAGIADGVVAGVRELGRATWFDRTPPNPTEAAVLEATEAFHAAECDGIVAIGGGSSIDLAKGVALRATHPGPLVDYAAVHGGMERITSGVVRTVAIPTTAGTGSEVGRAAMINVQGRKLDFISPHLFPARALCDPGLTFELPPFLTAATGMDALTHCIETYLSPLVNPPAEAIALDGVERAAFLVAAEASAQQVVAAAVLGQVLVDDQTCHEAAGSERLGLCGRGLDLFGQPLERRLPGELVDDVALGLGHDRVVPDRRAALGDDRPHRHVG
jgi:4-hydroxybutyrate dehydrogenase